MLHYRYMVGVTEIITIITDHTRQKQGIGKALMQKAERIGVKEDIHKIYLITGKGWEAIKFYKKMGFEQTGLLKNHYRNHDMLIFSKFLKSKSHT